MIVEIYAVAWQYRDRDNRDAETEPFTPWFLDKQAAQDICDEKNKEKMKAMTVTNAKEVRKKDRDNLEYEALVAAGFRLPRKRLTPFVQTRYDEPAIMVYAELEG